MKSRKLIALLLAAVMLIGTMTGCNQSTTTQAEVQNETENTTEENTETGVKKVKNLVIGTTTPNTTFNLYSQTDIFGRINYVGFVRGNWVYEIGRAHV